MSERPVILVVDDAPSSLGVLCEALEGAGYTVLIAKDGETALERLELVTPDAILLDAMMPKISGFDMLDILRTTEETKNAKAKARIKVIEKEIADLREKTSEIELKWKNEKETVAGMKDIKIQSVYASATAG